MELNLWDGIAEPKKSILKASLRVFAENGYVGASTREIAKEAGVANGLIFYHYNDKRTLFLELARHLRSIVAQELQSRQQDTGSFFEWVESFIEQKLRLYSGYPDVYRFFMLQIRQFPEQFDADSKDIRGLYPIRPEDDTFLAHEILYSALNGITTKLIQDFQTGSISADDFVKVGMKKAEEYITFFKELGET